MNSSHRSGSRLPVVGGGFLLVAFAVAGILLFGRPSPPAPVEVAVSAKTIDLNKTPEAGRSAKVERRKQRRAEQERRAQAQLAAEAVPMSERLAALRAKDGDPAAERPDLEMIRANGGKPLSEQQRRLAAERLIESGQRAIKAGDLGLVYEQLFRAVETYSSVETHAALGDILLKTSMASMADYHLRWAAEHDPGNPDRWIALANAYTLKIDPNAAYKAIAKARALDPDIKVVRDQRGFFKRRG